MPHTQMPPVRTVGLDPLDGALDAALDCGCTFRAIKGRIIFRYCSLHHAAPAMYGLLKEALGYLPESNPAMHSFWQAWVPKARTAIEKAEGR